MRGKSTWVVRVGVAALTAALVSAGAFAETGQVKIGDKIPDFALKDVNGKEHKLSDYAGKIVVLGFSCQNCPWSRGADPHLTALAKKYDKEKVVFLNIDSDKGTTPEEIKAYLEQNKLEVPVLKDEGNAYADALGAKQTPEMFVIDKDGKLAYHGAYDNREDAPAEGDINYVAKAVDSLLEGKPVETAEVKAWGCTIKRGKVASATREGRKEE